MEKTRSPEFFGSVYASCFEEPISSIKHFAVVKKLTPSIFEYSQK